MPLQGIFKCERYEPHLVGKRGLGQAKNRGYAGRGQNALTPGFENRDPACPSREALRINSRRPTCTAFRSEQSSFPIVVEKIAISLIDRGLSLTPAIYPFS